MQKKFNVIIAHGAYGYPTENWFEWLKQQLTEAGIACYVPAFPTPENQHLDTWFSEFEKSAAPLIHQHSILIGHSLGAAFILRWLERQQVSVSSVILVGAFIGAINNERFDKINQSFFATPFAWDIVQQRSQRFISYYGTGDQYVTREQYDCIAKHLNARKIIVDKAGHFNTESGYSDFPHLLSLLGNLTSSVECSDNDKVGNQAQ